MLNDELRIKNFEVGGNYMVFCNFIIQNSAFSIQNYKSLEVEVSGNVEENFSNPK